MKTKVAELSSPTGEEKLENVGMEELISFSYHWITQNCGIRSPLTSEEDVGYELNVGLAAVTDTE